MHQELPKSASMGTCHLPLEIQPGRKSKGIASDSDYSDRGGDIDIDANSREEIVKPRTCGSEGWRLL
jgi:hypothetical protein